jgi:hypothetical protein
MELIEEAYPGFDAADYLSWEDLADAMWNAHGNEVMEMYRAIGGDVYSDPEFESNRAIDHAADVLWIARTKG